MKKQLQIAMSSWSFYRTIKKTTLTVILILMSGIAGLNAQYSVNFEGAGETKTGYGSGNVTLSGISWNLTEALIGTVVNDWKNGDRSLRLRGRNGSVTSMVANKANGIGNVSFSYRTYGSDGAQQPWAVEYSTNDGGSWTPIGSNITGTGTVQTFNQAVNVTGNIRLRFRLTTTPGATGDRRLNIDDITITDYTGGPATPSITVAGGVSTFSYAVGSGPSAAQSVNISGADLTDNITVTAPANYQVSLTAGSGYANSVTLTQSAGTVAATPVFIRLIAGLSAGTYNGGNVSAASTGATTQTLTVNGTVLGVGPFNPGDLMFTGFNTDAPDGFAFVNWVSIPAGQTIFFTDKAWDGASLSVSEDVLEWNNNTGGAIAPGTVIVFNCAAVPATVDLGTVVSGSLSGLSASNENIFILTGSIASPEFVYGITNFAWLTTGTVSTTTSYLPSILNVANGNMVMPNTNDNWQYNASRSDQASIAAYKPIVANTGNWVSDDVTNISLSSIDFTVAGGPVATPSTTTLGLCGAFGSAGTASTFTLSGDFLTGNLLVTGTTNVEVSVDGISYFGSASIPVASGNIVGEPFTVYVRTTASYAVGPISGNISVSGGGITTFNIALTGTIGTAANLSSGDITILGANGTGTDRFSFVTWVSIPNNTVITFTDNAWETASGPLRTNENTLVWQNNTGSPIAAGTVIVFECAVSPATVDLGQVVSGSLNGLANGGDNIFAYQGPICNPTFLHGFITGGNWITVGLVSNANSYLPASLNNANGNIALTTGGNGEYTGSRSSQTVLNNYRALVNNTANWTIQGTEYFVLSSTDFSTGGPGVNLSVSSNTGSEAAATVITVTVTAEAPVSGDKTVTLAVTGAGITAGDYTIGSTSLVITNGNTSASTTFTVVDDILPEGLETATISITAVSAGAVIGVTSSQNIVITDNDNANIVINEIMYNNPGGDEEWIELYNGSPVAITLNSGWSLANSNPAWTINFPSSVTIPVGGYITVQVGSATGGASFPFTPTVVLSSAADRLVNSTSTLTLREGTTIIDQVTYADASPWPIAADGNGPSAALNGVALDNSNGANWGACKIGGTPGAPNPNCVSNIYYTISSGNVDGQIWATIPNGTNAILATFSPTTDLVVQSGHTVLWDPTGGNPVTANNLTMQSGSRIWTNITDPNQMRYLTLFGTFSNNDGIVGNGNTFDAFGVNIEGVNTTITGNGIFNFGRIRKNASTNTTSSVTINSNINLRFPGTCIYVNQPSTTFNLTVNAGRTINVIGDGLTAGSVAIDGTDGQGTGERAGVYNINGTLNVSGTLFALTNNVNVAFMPGITVGANGRINVNRLDMRADGLADVGFNTVINTGGRITVTGLMLQREGTFNTNGGLVLNNGASLLHGVGTPGLAPDPGGLVSGNIIVNINANSGFGKYNFWSSPVTGANILSITQSGLQFGSANNTYEYNPVNSTGTDVEGLRDGWVAKTNSDIMANGRGYITNSSPSARFTGPANNDIVNVALTGNGFTRFNLIGNPYPSTLNAAAFLAANGPSGTNQIVPAIYFWDDDGSEGVAYDAGDYVTTNSVGSSATGGNGSGTFSGTIAAGQGFFLAASPTGTSVQFTNAMRSSSNAFFFESEELTRVWLKVSNTENVKNETLLAFMNEATDGYDIAFDAEKFPGNEGLALYTTINEKTYAIQAWEKLNIERVIPIGLNANIPANHTFSLSQIENLDPTVMVYLEDRELGITTNLRVNDYTFNVTEAITGTGRFFLHMSAPAEISATSESCAGADGSIQFEASDIWNYSISNSENIVLATGNAFDQPLVSNLTAGDYVVTMSADGYTTTFIETVIASTPVTVTIEGENVVETNSITQFAALINGTETISWDFGDGSEMVSGTVVNHSYQNPGIYTVTAFASNDNCSAQQSMEIRVEEVVTGIGSLNDAAFSMFPNPANERVTIVTEENVMIEIADITGKIINTIASNNQKVNMIDTAKLSNGIYIVSLVNENGRSSRRLIIAH